MKQTSVLRALIGMFVLAVTAQPAQAVDLPAEAFALLAQASVETCAICAENDRNKAFAILAHTFVSGQKLTTDAGCLLVKINTDNEQELTLSCYPPPSLMEALSDGVKPPRLVFRFHTPEKHLVGIAPDDFTAQALAETYGSSPSATRFEGRLRYISYKYGDGEVFNYLLKSHTLLVHCIVEQIAPAEP